MTRLASGWVRSSQEAIQLLWWEGGGTQGSEIGEGIVDMGGGGGQGANPQTTVADSDSKAYGTCPGCAAPCASAMGWVSSS